MSPDVIQLCKFSAIHLLWRKVFSVLENNTQEAEVQKSNQTLLQDDNKAVMPAEHLHLSLSTISLSVAVQ